LPHQKNSLFEDFHADHAVLGSGFHALSQCLRANDIEAGRRVAEDIDTQAGAHVAFEEEDFYPALVPLLGDAEVQKLYREHDLGLEVIHALLQPSAETGMDQLAVARLLQESEAMETHIAECGELFAAIGRIPLEEQSALRQRLLQWRELNPRWRDYAARRRAGQPG
jgi:hypothetical protein